MKRLLFIAVALAITGFLMAEDVYAHGGSFRGPNGGVPPGLREPSDPEPPPPPPSDPGSPGGPTTPGDAPPGPTTPTAPDVGPNTGGAAPPPAPAGGIKVRKRTNTKSLTFESWRFWWAYNNDDILNLKAHIYAGRTSSSSPLFFSSKKDQENRRNAQRPTEAAIVRTVIPALLRSVNRVRDHEDIHGGALVALGKIGSAKYISMFADAAYNKLKNSKGRRVDFGPQATESAVLALGLIPNLDESAKAAVRKQCLDMIADEDLRTRERSWAAICLGLQRDTAAIRPLWDLLAKKYKDDNVPAGIIAGLGLIGDPDETNSIRAPLAEAFLSGKLQGVEISDRIRAFIGYALGKLGNPASLEKTINKVLKSRRYGRIMKRSAAIAAGILAATPECPDNIRDDTVKILDQFVNKSARDPSGENFAIIALSQIGTEKALNVLLQLAEKGKTGQQTFACLGLATHVFYNDNLSGRQKTEPMDKDLRAKIVKKLRDLSEKRKGNDMKACLMLCRGLVQDKTAIADMVTIISKKGSDPVLRGFCCTALGLLGDASENVKDALKIALQDRKSTDLRRQAATGLGLLRDAEVVKLLLGNLKKARSFAVQGQLITAIGTIGDHTAIDPLVRILDDTSQSAQTRAMAAVGLGMIGDLRPIPALSRVSKNYNYRASVADLDELLYIL